MPRDRIAGWDESVDSIMDDPNEHFDPRIFEMVQGGASSALMVLRAAIRGAVARVRLSRRASGGMIEVNSVSPLDDGNSFSSLCVRQDVRSSRGNPRAALRHSLQLSGMMRFENDLSAFANVYFPPDTGVPMREVFYCCQQPYHHEFVASLPPGRVRKFVRGEKDVISTNGELVRPKEVRSDKGNSNITFDLVRHPTGSRATARIDVGVIQGGEEPKDRVIIPEFYLTLTLDQAIALLMKRVNEILGFEVCKCKQD